MDQKTIFLEKRGCPFNGSNVGNYRLTTISYDVPTEDGRNLFIEFSNWVRYETRFYSKRGGKVLKHPKRELFNPNALHVNVMYEVENHPIHGNCCLGDSKLCAKIHALNLDYTREGIEKALKVITGLDYHIIILD